MPTLVPMATMDITQKKLKDWRVQMFEEMGFNEFQADTLSEARDDNGALIDTHYVRHMMEGGCTPELAIHILL